MKDSRSRENLWAPWRMAYILSAKDENDNACIFCERYPVDDDKNNLILYRGEYAFVIMNRFPYNSGHLMVVPYQHSGNLQKMSDEENSEMMKILQLCQQVLDEVMQPHGYNIGMNLGRVGGAGIEDHLHFHIVPRWNGDTNYMPVLANTKVISEALDKTYDKMKIVVEKFVQK